MTSTRKMVASHIRPSNSDMWHEFIDLAHARGLTTSKALEAAARLWLMDAGRWDGVLADPGPGRMTRVKPIVPGDFEPLMVPVEVAPFVDRWTSPPTVVMPNQDGTMPAAGEPFDGYPLPVTAQEPTDD